MKNIPEKYYKESNQREARANIRRWLSSGMSVKDIALQLSVRYEMANDSEKEHLGKLLASVYDFKSPATAKVCAFIFGIKMITNLSVGENIFIEGYKEHENLLFRKLYSPAVIDNMAAVRVHFEGERRRILPTSSIQNVLTINKAHHIYAVIHTNGEVSIFIVESCASDILIDEESFMGELPLYFTESTHFVSPVFKIKLVKDILEYCLKEIGYPAVTIKPKVIFADLRANLINRCEYDGPEAAKDDWRGIDVIMYRDIDPEYPIHDVGNLMYEECENGLIHQLRVALIHSISATAMICHSISINKKWLKLTPRVLAALCKKNNIFTDQTY